MFPEFAVSIEKTCCESKLSWDFCRGIRPLSSELPRLSGQDSEFLLALGSGFRDSVGEGVVFAIYRMDTPGILCVGKSERKEEGRRNQSQVRVKQFGQTGALPVCPT